MSKIYLLPETDEAKALLEKWTTHRSETIAEVSRLITERFGDNYDQSYSPHFWGARHVYSIKFKESPGPDWTASRCPDGTYRPKRSTKAGKLLCEWLKTLPTITSEAQFLGIEDNDAYFNRVQIIGHYPIGPKCLVVGESATGIPDGFKEITKAKWELILAEYAVELEETK